mmetsp:Transcript_7003/g.11763  ORF Transcript_7003/g.11763 Transcript_7003/m.11763 type:complete len:82 (+) Transcript_7003:293-538(+)
MIIAFPTAIFYFMYKEGDNFWNYSVKSFPFRRFGGTLLRMTLLVNVINIGYSLAFEDYCKRNSVIYDVKKRNSAAVKKLIN